MVEVLHQPLEHLLRSEPHRVPRAGARGHDRIGGPRRAAEKLSADETHVWIVEDFLADRPKLKHLRARKRGDAITLESGPKADPITHARVRRVTAQWWSCELPDHRGRWSEASLDRVPLTEALGVLHQVYPWALKPRE